MLAQEEYRKNQGNERTAAAAITFRDQPNRNRIVKRICLTLIALSGSQIINTTLTSIIMNSDSNPKKVAVHFIDNRPIQWPEPQPA